LYTNLLGLPFGHHFLYNNPLLKKNCTFSFGSVFLFSANLNIFPILSSFLCNSRISSGPKSVITLSLLTSISTWVSAVLYSWASRSLSSSISCLLSENNECKSPSSNCISTNPIPVGFILDFSTFFQLSVLVYFPLSIVLLL
jgi:hypothetical protein